MTHPTRIQGGNSRIADKFVVRLEDGLRDRIAVLAKDQGRSMNTYVVRALSRAVSDDENGVTGASRVMGTNSPCRFNGIPCIILKLYFENGDLTADIISAENNGLSVLYDALEPY